MNMKLKGYKMNMKSKGWANAARLAQKRSRNQKETPFALLQLNPKITCGILARATGYTRSYISKIFKGKRTPSLGTLAKLSECVGCSMETLYETIKELQEGNECERRFNSGDLDGLGDAPYIRIPKDD